MRSDPPSTDEPATRPDGSKRLSPNGQTVAIGVYGFLVLVGFFFGVVTGYDRPRPGPVARAERDKDQPRAETPKPPPAAPRANPAPPGPEPRPEPKGEPKPEPKKEPPRVEAKKVEPPKPEPKKDTVAPVTFKDVMVVLRKHCTECHGAGKAQGRVDVTSVAKMMTSKGKVLVPGKPDESDLYTSITEREMPKDRPRPTDAELAVIRNWILGGAKERRRNRPRGRRVPGRCS